MPRNDDPAVATSRRCYLVDCCWGNVRLLPSKETGSRWTWPVEIPGGRKLISQSKVASTVFLAFSLVSLGPGTAMAGCTPSLNGDGFNTCIGERALQANTSGDFNTAIGSSALFSNKSGKYNTANGQVSLNSNTRGNANTASGAGALYSNTLGNYNTAAGAGVMSSNTTGEKNVA